MPEITASAADVSNFENNLITNGFSAEEVADVMSLGLTSTDIASALEQLETLDPALLAGIYLEQLDVFAAQLSSETAVPEPSTVILLGSALLVLCLALIANPHRITAHLP